jgi:hypothetical protein
VLHLLMLIEGKVVSRDIPEIKIADFKDISDFRADIRSGGDRAASEDHENEERDFSAGKQGPAVTGPSEPEVIDELQQTPADQQSRPVARNIRPDSDRISQIVRQKQAANRD